MKKHYSKIAIIAGALMLTTSLVWMLEPYYTWALEQQNGENPCSVELEYEEPFFELENMNPGQTESNSVTIRKTGSIAAKLYFAWRWESDDSLFDAPVNLADQMTLRIVIRDGDEPFEGQVIEGPFKDFLFTGATPLPDRRFQITHPGFEDLEWIYPGQDVTLDITIHLDGPGTGNEYQGAEFKARMVIFTDCGSDLPDRPAINIEKATNGIDADEAPGPNIPAGSDVVWTYVVTNQGNVPLSDIIVTDNIEGVNPVYVSGDENEDGILQVDETWVFEAEGTAEPGNYANIGTVVGTSVTDGTTVTDSDPSHYFGISTDVPAINIEKATNGFDADLPPGPSIPEGSLVTWTYVVTNPGNAPLRNVRVTDNRAGVNPVYVRGDDNGDGILQVGETWVFEATGIAVLGQYDNVGTVVGTSVTDGTTVTASDPSHYFGFTTNTPGIDIEKLTNGVDADAPTGPFIPVGNTVTWTYIVTNTGNKSLRDVEVTDNRTGVNPVYVSGDINGDGIMQVNEVWVFEATGTAVPGQYANIGTVVGTSVFDGSTVTASDPSHYFGIATGAPAIDIEKATNGVDADLPPGPVVPIGSLVTWTYVVTNPGTDPLRNIVVTDNRTGVNPVYISGDINNNGILEVGETWLYRATGVATAGQYSNIGTVTGISLNDGSTVTASDPSHYFGETEIVIPPEDPELEPDPDPDREEDDDSVVIIAPDDPLAAPPLPRTDGYSVSLFLVGLLLLAVGIILKRSASLTA